MLKLESPEYLFNKRKVYAHTADVDKLAGASQVKALLVYNSNGDLNPAHREMLDKMMAACKFKEGETAYVNAAAAPVSLSALQNQYKPGLLVVFGDIVLSKNLAKPVKYVPIEMSGAALLYADTLAQLGTDGAAKKKLWGALQRVLGLA